MKTPFSYAPWTALLALLAGCNVHFDSPAECPGGCASGYVCNSESHTCVPGVCGIATCKANEKCGLGLQCYVPCNGVCGAAAYCDDSIPPGKCAPWFGPTQWGATGDGQVQKITRLELTPKQDACDLNGDGVGDNAYVGLAGLVSTSEQDAVASGYIDWLLESKPWRTDGQPMILRVLQGAPADPTHFDGTLAGGQFNVVPSSFDLAHCSASACPAVVEATDATVTNGTLHAFTGSLKVPVFVAFLRLNLKISAVAISGDVAGTAAWQTTKNGRICGYVLPADLKAALAATPDLLLAQFGGRDAVEKDLSGMTKLDVDTDGDGVKDASSIALTFETGSAKIVGLSADPP